jgi:hypothetical protein
MKKFIITRLGVDFPNKNQTAIHQINDSGYTLKTVMDMLDFTYPSIKNQTAKEINWVFYTGQRLTDAMRKLIEDVVEIPVQFIRDIEYKNAPKQWEKEESIVLRLDADDYMHPTLIEKVEKNLLAKYNGKNIVICNPVKGYKFYPDMSLTEFQAPSIAIAQGVISNCGAGVLHDHTKLVETFGKQFPDKEIIKNNIETDERLYLYRRHELAHSFICDADYQKRIKIDNSDKILQDFGVKETLFWKKRNV